MLNWLPNVEFNKESRFFTTKDVAENAEKIQTADKALRDLKRKRAVEKATAESIDSKGDIKEDIARESLKRSGFGEEADTLVNEITTKKTAKSKENLDFRKNLLEAVALGTVKQDVAEKLFGGPLQDTVQTQAPASVPESVVEPPVVSSDVRSGGLPLSPAALALINGSKPQVGPQQAPPAVQSAVQSAPITTTSQASSQSPSQPSQSNFSPRYAQMGPMDFSQLNGDGSKVNPVTFALSDDPLLASYQKKAAAGSLGGLDSEKASNENIASRIQQIAENKFPKKSPAQFMTDGKIDMGKFLDYDRSRQSNIEGHKQELAKAVLSQANQMRSTDLDARKTVTGEKGQQLTEDKATIQGFSFKSDPSIILDITNQTNQANQAGKLALELKGMKTTDPAYKGKVMTLGKTLIQAKGLGVSEGVLDAMQNQMGGAGFDIANFIKKNASTASEAGQNFLRELYRSQTTGSANFEDMVKDVQRANRDKLAELGPSSFEGLVARTPILGESNAEKQKWIDEREKIQNLNAPKTPTKPKTAKQVRDNKIKSTKSSAEGL